MQASVPSFFLFAQKHLKNISPALAQFTCLQLLAMVSTAEANVQRVPRVPCSAIPSLSPATDSLGLVAFRAVLGSAPVY